jgi:DNA-binding phage protein
MKKNIMKTKVIEADFFADYAKTLKNDSAKLRSFKKRIIEEYNKTKDMPLFLENLKILAMAKGNVSGLAKKSKVQRHSVYKILSKDSNPLLINVVNIMDNLDICFVAKAKTD